jgi:tryptophan-rich sensory protein
MVASAKVDRPAAWLLAPYLAWVAYATTLNAGIVAMN